MSIDNFVGSPRFWLVGHVVDNTGINAVLFVDMAEQKGAGAVKIQLA